MLLNLEEFIQAVTYDTKAHVCVVDVSGMTERDILSVSAARTIHSSEFCDRAKLLHGGLRLCMRCRNRVKNKILDEKKPLCGKCSFGVGEVVYPVISEGRVLCIVSVGMLCDDADALVKKTKKAAAMLRSKADNLIEAVPLLQPCDDYETYTNLAKAICSYILLLYNTIDDVSSESVYHEVVAAAIDYVAASYYKEISIEDIARVYGLGAKYIGRLFKEQTGESFNSCLNRVRIHHAKRLLSGTKAQIIEIALECGYNNVAYFNRVFKNSQGVTPSEYRQLHQAAGKQD